MRTTTPASLCHWRSHLFLLFFTFVDVQSLSPVQLFATPWTVARHAPLSMEFSEPRILEWVAISFSKDLSDPGIELMPLASPANLKITYKIYSGLSI